MNAGGGDLEIPLIDRSGTSKTQVGGIQVDLFNDEDFAAIRARFGTPSDFLQGFDFKSVCEGGGGKGGNLMGYTPDQQYVVKELNAVDQSTLLGISSAYRSHVCGAADSPPPNSLLCRIFMHFRHTKTGANFQVMNNCLRSVNDPTLSIDDDYQYHAYDLKGTNDDRCLAYYGEGVKQVRKELWMYGGQCLWSEDRKKYYQAKQHALFCKFHVTVEQRNRILEAIRYDSHWLATNGLMDYSLIVCKRTIRLSHTATALGVRHTIQSNMQPLVSTHDDLVHVMHLGVIDFLQVWNCMKIAANCIKMCDRNKSTEPPPYYADRFARYFAEKFIPDATTTIELTAEELEEVRREEQEELLAEDDGASRSSAGEIRRTNALQRGSWRATSARNTACSWRSSGDSWRSSQTSIRSADPSNSRPRRQLPAIASIS
jgi:hypothetical protein